jgi:hypothetical protein
VVKIVNQDPSEVHHQTPISETDIAAHKHSRKRQAHSVVRAASDAIGAADRRNGGQLQGISTEPTATLQPSLLGSGDTRPSNREGSTAMKKARRGNESGPRSSLGKAHAAAGSTHASGADAVGSLPVEGAVVPVLEEVPKWALLRQVCTQGLSAGF